MPKYWGKQIFRKKLNDGNNNGQLRIANTTSRGARKATCAKKRKEIRAKVDTGCPKKKLCSAKCYTVLAIAPVPCCSQKLKLCSLKKDINSSIFHIKDFLRDQRGLRNWWEGKSPLPILVVNQHEQEGSL